MDAALKEKLSFGILLTILAVTPFFSGGRDIFGFLLIVICIVPLVLFVRDGDNFPGLKNKFILPFAIFILITSVATFVSPNFYISFSNLVWWLIYFFVFISSIVLFRSREYLDFTVRVLVGVALIVGIIGLIYFFQNTSIYLRMYSVIDQHNALGGFLLLPISLTFGFFLSTNERFKQIGWGIIGIFLLSIFFLTFSRGSLLSLVFAMVIVGILSYHKKVGRAFAISCGKIVALSFLGVALAFALFKVHQVANKSSDDTVLVYQGETAEANGISLRVNFWKHAAAIFTKKPLLGVGPGNYPEGNRVYREITHSFTLDPHNTYLKALAETGIGAISIWIFFILIGVRALIYARKNTYDYTALALSVGILAILFHIGMDVDWRYPANTLVFFVFAGALVAQGGTLPNSKHAIWFTTVLTLTFLTCVSGFLIFQSTNHLEEAKFYMSKAKDDLAREELIAAQNFNFFKNSQIPFTRAKLEKDASYFDQAISYAPYDASFYLAKADLLRKKGDAEGEESALLKAIEYNRGSSILPTIYLTELYLKEEKYKKAVTLLETNLPWYEYYMSTDFFKSDPSREGIIANVAQLKAYLLLAKKAM